MQQRLPKNSQDLVSKSFKNHIILKVIDKSCKQYGGCVISLWRTLFYIIYCIILEVS